MNYFVRHSKGSPGFFVRVIKPRSGTVRTGKKTDLRNDFWIATPSGWLMTPRDHRIPDLFSYYQIWRRAFRRGVDWSIIGPAITSGQSGPPSASPSVDICPRAKTINLKSVPETFINSEIGKSEPSRDDFPANRFQILSPVANSRLPLHLYRYDASLDHVNSVAGAC